MNGWTGARQNARMDVRKHVRIDARWNARKNVRTCARKYARKFLPCISLYFQMICQKLCKNCVPEQKSDRKTEIMTIYEKLVAIFLPQKIDLNWMSGQCGQHAACMWCSAGNVAFSILPAILPEKSLQEAKGLVFRRVWSCNLSATWQVHWRSAAEKTYAQSHGWNNCCGCDCHCGNCFLLLFGCMPELWTIV